VTFLAGIRTYPDHSYIFSGGQDPKPPGSTPPAHDKLESIEPRFAIFGTRDGTVLRHPGR